MSIEDERAIKAVAAMSPSYTVEQALRVQDLAQLGARVLEILRLRNEGITDSQIAFNVDCAARSLGLLEAEAQKASYTGRDEFDEYDVNDPATYESRFCIERIGDGGGWLARGAFGYTWVARDGAEFFTRAQARRLMAGKFPCYGWRGETARIVDSAGLLDAEGGAK